MKINQKKCVIQVLPALDSGGVERGTLEMADYLVKNNWKSIVISSGGKLETRLTRNGSRHITLPVHTKNQDGSSDENEGKPAGNDVRDEHGTIVKAGFQKVLLPADGTVFRHIKGLLKTEGARFEEVAFLATGAFQVENAVGFGSFSKQTHGARGFLKAAKVGWEKTNSR